MAKDPTEENDKLALAKKRRKARRKLKRESPAKWKAQSLRSSLKSRGPIEVDIKKVEELIFSESICTYCGNKIEIKQASYDHILPLSRGGKHGWSNLRLIDFTCNLMKGNLTDEEFRELMDFLKKRPSIYEILKTRLKAAGFMYRGK